MMEEGTARSVLRDDLNVPRETLQLLDRLVDLVIAENSAQNLISASTIPQIWTRHILDSAQLVRFAPPNTVSWLDLGTGAGFPGLVVAVIRPGDFTLIEERRKRVDFLERAVALLGIGSRVTILQSKVEKVLPKQYDVISARAFAPLEKLFDLSHSFSTVKTRFILPKGKNARSELEAVKATWQGEFRLEQSITDPDAQIVIAERVSRRTGDRKSRGSGER